MALSTVRNLVADNMFVNKSTLVPWGLCMKLSLSQLEIYKWNLGVNRNAGIDLEATDT